MSQPLRKEREVFLPPQEEQAPVKRPERRRSFNLSKSKLPVLMVALLLGYLAVSMGSQFSRLSAMQREVTDIQQQVQELKQKNASLREELHLVQSDAYIEKFRVLQHPNYAEMLCREIARRFEDERISVVIGPTTGGIIISYEVAKALGARAIFAEREDGR
ncbi:MAG: septum formation initiator family protein, partial [Firmicutes bacterium]|nr:septum formation initiator family protein [Bacillota bacterium]